MAGEGGSPGARPTRVRPHWWAVLAVSLALLALVAATASNHQSTPAPHGTIRATGALHHPPASALPPASATSTTSTTTATSTVTSTTMPASAAAGGSAAAQVVVHESSPTTTTTTAPPTTTTVAPSTSSAVAAPSQTLPPFNGSLQQPHDTSATYSFTETGPTEVSVSWTPATTLSLSVSCQSGVQTEEGSSTISVAIPDPEGPCDIALKEMLVQYDAVNYTITIGPEGG